MQVQKRGSIEETFAASRSTETRYTIVTIPLTLELVIVGEFLTFKNVSTKALIGESAGTTHFARYLSARK